MMVTPVVTFAPKRYFLINHIICKELSLNCKYDSSADLFMLGWMVTYLFLYISLYFSKFSKVNMHFYHIKFYCLLFNLDYCQQTGTELEEQLFCNNTQCLKCSQIHPQEERVTKPRGRLGLSRAHLWDNVDKTVPAIPAYYFLAPKYCQQLTAVFF